MICKIMKLFKIGDTGVGGGEYRVVLIEQLRSWQLPQKKREELFRWRS
jgi:hypothetical protein